MSEETTVETTEESYEDTFNALVAEDENDAVLLEEDSRDTAGEGDPDLQASPEKPADSTETVAEGGDQGAGEEPGEGVSSEQDSGTDQGPTLEELKAQNNQLLQYRRSNEGRVSALQQKINQLEQRPAPQRQPPPPANITPEKWGEFEEEYPEIAQAINARMGTMEQTISRQVSGQIGQAVQPLQNAEQTRYLQSQYVALEAAHPDWKDVVKGEPFKDWLHNQPKAVQQIMNSEDAGEASSLISYYKSSQTPSVNETSPQEAKSEVTDIQAKRQQQLREATNIPSRKSSGQNNAIPEDDYEAAFAAFAKQEERKLAQRGRL